MFRWIHARGVTDFAQMTDLSQELRAKLAETRASDEPARTDASPPEPGRDPDSRRQDVHDRARQRIDELH